MVYLIIYRPAATLPVFISFLLFERMSVLRKREHKKRVKRTYGWIWFLFLIVLLIFARLLEVSMFARQIASVSLCFVWFYGVLLIFEKLRFLPARRKGSGDPAPEASAEPSPQAKEGKGKTVLSVVYIVLQTAILLLFGVNQFTGTVRSPVYYDSLYGTLHIFITGIVAVACFMAAGLLKNKPPRAGSETARGLLQSFGVIAAVTVVFLILYTVLGIQCLNLLSWIVRILIALTALSLLVGLALSVIRREILSDFNYPAPLDLFRRSRGKSLASVLEESTGLSVKSLYSIRYAAGILPGVLLGLVLVLFVSTCFFKVESYEEAVVYRFGAIRSESAVGPGLHLKLPWPIEKAELYDVDRVRELSVGYEDAAAADNLWTQAHAGEEYKLLLGNGNELVSINMKLTYVISDLYRYVTSFSDPAAVLGAKAYEVVMNKTINTDLDTLLSVDRDSFSSNVLRSLNTFCGEAALGVTVNEVILESIHPPVDIAGVYQNVVSASVMKSTLRTNAEAAAAETLAGAEQTANTAIIAAKTDQTKRVADARYEMDVFLAAAESYRSHPDALTLAKYMDTFQTVVSDKKVYVFIGQTDLDRFVINRANSDVAVVTETLPE